MEPSLFFLSAWGLMVAYVLLGNYLYFAQVLPALKENPSGSPSVQLSQVDRYLAKLAQAGVRPWFHPYLRHIRVVTLLVAAAFLFTLVVFWGRHAP
jgi:hypothetical protein